MSNFDRCIGPVILLEGGLVNDPDDPGRMTRYGVSQRVFPHEDIEHLTLPRAIEIYYNHYFKRYGIDRISDAEKALNIFDYAVNAGGRRAIRTAQQIVGFSGKWRDGILGPHTAEAIDERQNFVRDYKHARIVFYEYIANKYPRKKKFLWGWLRRVSKLEL